MEDQVRKPIKFDFQIYDPEIKKSFTVEKSDTSGTKHRFIEGVASGPRMDQHEERMTPDCIKNFVEQANSGVVLLYCDLHGIRSTEDIGILKEARIQDDGDWWISCRLYDDTDSIDKASIDTANKVWLQINGLPPYPRPIQKGFSIEGFIGPSGILSAEKDASGQMRKRVINKVDLDGVVLVPRPAYQYSKAKGVYKSSIDYCCYKALGEIFPEKAERLAKDFQSSLAAQLSKKDTEKNYNEKRWDLESALYDKIEIIMSKPDYDKQDQLEILFDEYKNLMIPLIIQSETAFQSEEPEEEINPYNDGITKKVTKSEVLKNLRAELPKFLKIYEKMEAING